MWIFWTSEEPLFFVLFNLYLANKANKWDSPSCFALPYAHENAVDEGVSAGGSNIFSWYGKSASNMGFLTLRAFAKEGDVIGGESNSNGWSKIAVLPEGFRSKTTVTFLCVGDPTGKILLAFTNSNGGIWAKGCDISRSIFGACSYPI